jgi:hypothetical protein
MITIRTVQQFVLEYEVPDAEYLAFMSMLEDGEDIGKYEVDQEYLGEEIVYSSRN